METRQYAAAVWHRSLWVGAAGIAATAAFVGIGLLSSPTYTATSSLFVGVSQVDGPQGLAWGSLVQDEVLPSIARLGTSPAVLGPVVDELSLHTTAAKLAGSIDVAPVVKTSLLVVTAQASTASGAADLADAVAKSLSSVATTAHAGAEGTSYLRAEILGHAREPRFRTAPNLRAKAVRGLAVGLLGGVILSGLAELARPRIRSAAGAAAVTSLPILAGLAATGRPGSRGPDRRAAVDRLAWLLRSSPTVPDVRRLLLLGTAPEVARRLAGELGQVAGAGVVITPITASELSELSETPSGGRDGLVVVASGRTTRRSLAATVATAEESPIPVAGVVLDGVLPAAAGRRARFRAALRGDAPLPQREADARPSGARRVPWLTPDRIVAGVAIFAVGLNLPLPASTSTALLPSLVLLPVWISAIPRFRGARLLCWLAVLGLVSGLLLAGWSAAGRGFAGRAAIEIPILLLTGLGAIGLLLWARGVLPVPAIGTAYGLGLLVHGVLNAPQSVNAFKFELSLPITIVVLSLAGMRRGRLPAVLALGTLGVADVLNDARSAFGFCIIAAGLVVWQLRPVVRAGRTNAWTGILLLGAAAVGVYFAGTELMVAGALGEEVQVRTTTQIAQSGSLLLGGRPEWTATWALMQERPWGYGLGVVPDSHDVAVAKSGMAVTHIPTVQGYLEHFMLTDRFELHSVAADLWSALGPVGLAYAVAMGSLLVASLAHLLTRREATGLACFIGLTAIWNVAFGTLPSNGLDVAFAVGLMLLPRGPRTGPAGDPGAPARRAMPRRRPVAAASAVAARALP